MYEKAREILRQVAKEYFVSVHDITSTRRRKWEVIARQETMRRMREDLKMSYPEIAFILKRTDHTTVLYGVKRARARLKEEVKI